MKQEVYVFTSVSLILLPTLFFVVGVVSNFRNIKRLRKEWVPLCGAKPKWIEIFSTNGIDGNASILGSVCMSYFYVFISAYAFVALVELITYLIVE